MSKHISLPVPDEYRISYEALTGNLQVVIDGIVVANSDRVMILHESYLTPSFYFPREDVDFSLLKRGQKRTFCPFKGTATHWHLQSPTSLRENIAWSYDRPLDAGKDVDGYICFYNNQVDEWIGSETYRENLTSVHQSEVRNNDLSDWVINEAWQAQDAADLTRMLAQRLVDTGMALIRINIGIWTLHPQLVGVTYNWTSERNGVLITNTPRGQLQSAEYLQSPVRYVTEGLGGIRQKLDEESPEFNFPVMQELREAGGTDYVAMPLWFSDGQTNTLTLTSEHPEGFTVANLGQFYRAIPVLARLYEVHTLRRNTSVLLDTYLGKRTGQRVLNGLTQRGDGEDIHAVIWFCDLRGSSALADSMPREEFLSDLNKFFDAMGGAIEDQGGEVLRFIGDAVLAIFPIGDDVAGGRVNSAVGRTCFEALEAVRDAQARMTDLNKSLETRGKSPLGYGIGLHLGKVTYGNIGTESRLEHTVIGAAANEAARVESLCKVLNKPVLISGVFARESTEQLEPLGKHALSGVADEMEIFTLPDRPF
jgi:adenylate cyclase